MNIQSRKKLVDGRCVAPEETIALLEQQLAGHDYWIHEEQVAEHLHWSVLYVEALEFRSMGKGVTAALSRAGALAEAAEWLLAREVVDLPGYTVSHQDALGEEVVGLEDLLSHVAAATPPLLAELKNLDAAQHWVDAMSLTRGEAVKVPIEYLSQIGGPNGKASGNSLEEAIVHAALEVFERRAHITTLRQRLVVPTIDPSTISDPLVLEHMAFLKERGIEWIVKDLSFGGVLPCVGVYFHDPHIPENLQFKHFFKVGSSFDRRLALTRCFTEYVQGRLAHEFIDGSPSEQERILQHDFRQIPAQPNRCDNFLSAFMFGFVPYQSADFLWQGETVPFDAGEAYVDLREDIDAAIAVCDALGKELIVVDHSDPDTGFAVAQVVVPGYSDAIPYHPASSPVLYRAVTRPEVVAGYA